MACSTFCSSQILWPTPYSLLFASKPRACAPLRLLNFEENNQLIQQSCADRKCCRMRFCGCQASLKVHVNQGGHRMWETRTVCRFLVQDLPIFLLSCIVWARHLLWFCVEAPSKDGLKSETEHRKKKRRKEKPDVGGDGTSNQGAAPKKLKLTINFKASK